MMPFSRILVPTDYSEAADAALGLAGRIARAEKGWLLVAHVMPLPVYTLAEYPIWPIDGRWIAEETVRLREHVRKVLALDGKPPPFEVDVTVDTPFVRIVQLAAERHVDLIVMGTHGHSGLRRLVLGSVTEKVVRSASCPVLTAHGPVAVRTPTTEHAARPVRRGEIATLMQAEPITIEPDAMLEEARRLMTAHRVRHLPVVECGKLVGILSDVDLGPHVGQLARTKVNVAMTPNPTCLASDDDAMTAARTMLDHKVRALPVVDGDRVVGVVSVSDVLEDYLRTARTETARVSR